MYHQSTSLPHMPIKDPRPSSQIEANELLPARLTNLNREQLCDLLLYAQIGALTQICQLGAPHEKIAALRQLNDIRANLQQQMTYSGSPDPFGTWTTEAIAVANLTKRLALLLTA